MSATANSKGMSLLRFHFPLSETFLSFSASSDVAHDVLVPSFCFPSMTELLFQADGLNLFPS